ncbi:uncharacterized protein LOC124540391 [Vanessa cardui]|uniref:uncharacterized protein LOC124540391 n=1 Tax=Vanessa cardui TaxID=171605 RepID=UPI001F1378B1|nr:uncharacterized protein LOC124540391 [Vanessa cardui]
MTTAYHPAANGIIERFHRQLKAAIMCHTNQYWTEYLPLVLLGIRSAYKEDIQSSAAEMLYGETLRLPGQFFADNCNSITDISDYISRLRSFAAQIRPVPAAHHTPKKRFVFRDLDTADQVFLRQDALRKSLQPPYTGPYQVIKRGQKTFQILVKNKKITVSIDRLKPAYTIKSDSDTGTEQQPNVNSTRNGLSGGVMWDYFVHILGGPRSNVLSTTCEPHAPIGQSFVYATRKTTRQFADGFHTLDPLALANNFAKQT